MQAGWVVLGLSVLSTRRRWRFHPSGLRVWGVFFLALVLWIAAIRLALWLVYG
jgi:hypothetical protein